MIPSPALCRLQDEQAAGLLPAPVFVGSGGNSPLYMTTDGGDPGPEAKASPLLGHGEIQAPAFTADDAARQSNFIVSECCLMAYTELHNLSGVDIQEAIDGMFLNFQRWKKLSQTAPGFEFGPAAGKSQGQTKDKYTRRGGQQPTLPTCDEDAQINFQGLVAGASETPRW